MLRRLIKAFGVVAILGGACFWYLTTPVFLQPNELAKYGDGDAQSGEMVFWAGGCGSCHAEPKAKGDEKLKLGGGQEFVTQFGTFIAPNISPNKTHGIGAWSVQDFANALKRGLSPKGEHYYPAFPYTSYTRMTPDDISNLFAFMKTLPPIDVASKAQELKFPFNIRRGLGLWQKLNLKSGPVVDLKDNSDELIKRGQYLVEGVGHCGACHTPRDIIGGLDYSHWLAGAQSPDGPGKIPNITPSKDGIGSWSAKDIAYYLESGFTPDFDSVGGAMVSVQENMAKLPSEDRDAIAAYLKAIPQH